MIKLIPVPTIIQNSTDQFVTLPTGRIVYIKVSVANEKPKYYRVIDINTLVQNVYSDMTEPKPQTNYTVQYKDETHFPQSFSLHHVVMTKLHKVIITILSIMYSPLLILQNLEFFLHHNIPKKISNSIMNIISNFLTTLVQNM